VEIRDYGVGIPDSIMEKIFSIDRMSTRFGTQGEKGTGFGLPLVKKFITEYGGGIDIQSKDESSHPNAHGTSVTLHLKSDT
jgi:signal transduction histidine kinase